MMCRLQPWICLGLLTLAACERPDESARQPDDSGAGPKVTKSGRPPREAPADSRKTLRESLARAEMIGEPRARTKALAEVVWNALELDPEFAREALGRLSSDSPERIPLIQHFAMRLADEDPDAALKWADGLESEQESAAARARIALVIADADPRRAANLLSESGVAGRELDVAIVQVLQRWAGQNAPDAAAWVAMFPPGGFRKAGVETVVTQWVESDTPAAFSWLAGLRDENIRSEATQAMTQAWLQQPPDTREVWLQAADARTREEIERAARHPK
jgi:hypothetical protein